MSDFLKKYKNDPFAKFLGVEIEDSKKGYAKCSVILTGDMSNFLNTPHGGLIFSLADIAFAGASNFENPASFALDVSGSFLKGAKIGDKLTAVAEEIASTKRTGNYRMNVYCNSELIATFMGTVFRKAE
jgi:acyl-CoA thioesterase